MDSMLEAGKQTGPVLCFGELLLRMCPDADGEWLSNNRLPFYLGGAELNVATALARWGLPSKYFTAIPQNDLSTQIVRFLQNKGIDTSPVHYGVNRLGLLYLSGGHDLKHGSLIYDRSESAFATLMPGVIDWEKVLDGVSWFHFSAICPAVSQNAADVCREVLEAASKKNITISVDMNYRSKLWKYGKSPLQVMPGLVAYCDVVMGNVWAAETMLGIPVIPNVHESGLKSIYLKEALKTSEAISEKYPKCKVIANTFRFDSTKDIKYYTTLYHTNQFYNSNEYETAKVVDKVGSGDCFMAGLIYGFYNKLDPRETLEFATAAAFGKLFEKGDATNQNAEEIKKLIK